MRHFPALSLAALATAAWAAVPAEAQAAPSFPSRTCNVRSYGAQASRIFPDTAAFQRAIDDCAGHGGGIVEVPRGEYLIGPIFLASNINLHLAAYSEIFGDSEPSLYKAEASRSAFAGGGNWIALVNIADARNVAITGAGRIDGQGSGWWERWTADSRRSRSNDGTNRPRLVQAFRSSDLLFEGVTLMDSPSFNLVIDGCEKVTVRGMSILAPAHSPNTDAIDPIDTRDMLIENNFIDVGDDVVAIKSSRVDPRHPEAAVENIVIRGNRGRAGRGISIGSGSVGGVRHVLVENNEIRGGMYGIRIKTPRGKGGLVQDVVFRNNRLVDVEVAMVFSSYYETAGFDYPAVEKRLKDQGGFVLGHQIYPPESEPPQQYRPNATPWIRGILVDGLVATADKAGVVIGLPEKPIDGITFRNVRVKAREGLLVRNARIDARGLDIAVTDGQPIRSESGAVVEGRQ
ncbi:MAG: glycoside hydrolase, family 28 [Alphaproteobacteria bacterium]|nr:glycoside hydrolase, family 28 [Alphaproteobacteria bacterium]